ncbi:MAG: glycosyltransferase family 4 protein [Gemmatimonadetes bacterium]|nr:glycosyltransferase family 4 protein [Gemmatimonadota bacterium]
MAPISPAKRDLPTARTLLILSQVYLPDPASVGQHVADAAAEMARRGWRVVVLTSRNGYDDPSVRYPSREVRDGVEIVRLPWCSFGKGSIAVRLIGGFSFVIQSILRGLAVGRVNVILVSTSPPMASLGALALAWLRRASIKFWIMDLNPDQMVVLGRLAPHSVPVRVFDWINRRILRRAEDVVVLDRFMADRVNAKLQVREKLSIIPPWPLDDYLAPVPHSENPFRVAHGLQRKFVVMYSGNHGPTNPFTTILEAAAALRDDARIVFVFIGGGVGKREVESAGLPNVLSLPYQPLDTLRYSLSAADVHLVTIGDEVVGVVHPCKVYGAMAVARPILLLGPSESHVGDILGVASLGWTIRHGDVAGAVALLRSLLAMAPADLEARGERGRALLASKLSKAALCGRLCDVVERGSRDRVAQDS